MDPIPQLQLVCLRSPPEKERVNQLGRFLNRLPRSFRLRLQIPPRVQGNIVDGTVVRPLGFVTMMRRGIGGRRLVASLRVDELGVPCRLQSPCALARADIAVSSSLDNRFANLHPRSAGVSSSATNFVLFTSVASPR